MRVFVFSSLLLVALTGCAPFWAPSPIPSGYAHHGKVYKSPPGPETYKYEIQKNEDLPAVTIEKESTRNGYNN